MKILEHYSFISLLSLEIFALFLDDLLKCNPSIINLDNLKNKMEKILQKWKVSQTHIK